MSEEKQTPQPAPEEQKSQPSPAQQHRSKKSVFQYLAILFAAAFLLLLFTFVMEKRQYEQRQEQSEEQIDDLQQSTISAANSLNELLAENEKLRQQVGELTAGLEQSEEDRQLLIKNVEDLSREKAAKEKAVKALDWFWQIDEAYVRGRFSKCRELIQSIEDAGLVGYLPQESITDNGRFSPYHRFWEIKGEVS